jgi:hypothetical protein
VKVQDGDYFEALFSKISKTDLTEFSEEDKKLVNKEIDESVRKKAYSEAIPTVYAWVCVGLFVITNLLVTSLICIAFKQDIAFIEQGKDVGRLITSNVIIALISGVTAQMAAAFLVVTKYFFTKSKEIESKSASVRNRRTINKS